MKSSIKSNNGNVLNVLIFKIKSFNTINGESESRLVVSNSLRPMDCIVHGILQARILEWVAFPFSRGSSQPRDWTQVSHIAGGFFTSWATREAQEYWSGYLFLLQQILLTQELNRGLLHCRQTLPTELSGKLVLFTKRTTVHFSSFHLSMINSWYSIP